MTSSRRAAWCIAAASLAGLVTSGYVMAGRIKKYHDEHPRTTFVFQNVEFTEFEFAGRPVQLVDDLTDPAQAYMNVSYGEESLRLPVTIPPDNRLPGLVAYTDWLRILRFAPMTGRDISKLHEDLDSGKVADRLVIVTRTPRPGTNPETWGAAWKRDWTFDFYELKPEGGFVHERLGWPTNKLYEPSKPGELAENSWQFQASLQLMPRAGRNGPSYKFTDTAVSRLGWTLQVGAVSGVLLAVSLAWANAPASRRRTETAPESPKA